MKLLKSRKFLPIIIFTILILIGCFFYFLKIKKVVAEEEVKIFPTSYTGDWQNIESIFLQDLDKTDGFINFNNKNSAYPKMIEKEVETLSKESFLEKENEIKNQNLGENINESSDNENESSDLEIQNDQNNDQEILPIEPPIEDSQSEVIENNQPQNNPSSEDETIEENNLPSLEPISFWQQINPFRNPTGYLDFDIDQLAWRFAPSEWQDVIFNGAKNLFIIKNVFAEEDQPAVETNNQEAPSEQITEDILEVSNFFLSDDFSSADDPKIIKNAQLRVSMTGRGGDGDKLLIEYSYNGNSEPNDKSLTSEDQWQNIGEINLNGEVSNATNGGYWLFGLPIFQDWIKLKDFKIRFIYLDTKKSPEEEPAIVLIDAVWLEMSYEKIINQDKEISAEDKLKQENDDGLKEAIFPLSVNGDWQEMNRALGLDLNKEDNLNNFSEKNCSSPIQNSEDLKMPIIETPIASPDAASTEVENQAISNDNNDEENVDQQNNSQQAQEIIDDTIENNNQLEPSIEEPQIDNQNQENNQEEQPVSFLNKLINILRPNSVLAQSDDVNQEFNIENQKENDLSEQQQNDETALTEKSIEFTNFNLSKGNEAKLIKNIQLKFSFAGQGESGDKLQINYFYAGAWQNLGELNLAQETSNATNQGYFYYDLPILENLDGLDDFKIKFTSISNDPATSKMFLDAAWLEIEYTEDQETEFEIQAVKKDWRIDETPVFKIVEKNKGTRIKKEKVKDNIVGKLFNQVAGIFTKPNFEVNLIEPNKREISIREEKYFNITADSPAEISIIRSKDFRPGLHQLTVNFEKGGKVYNLTQDFTWGVLTINTNKSVYTEQDDKAYIQMAALRDDGHTICDAVLELNIENKESGQKTTLSTKNGEIKYSPTCGINNVTDQPDYFVYYPIDRSGIYEMKLKNINNGYEITDSFEVQPSAPLEVERVGATRINPFLSAYVMTFKVKANQDFNGELKEFVPSDFKIIRAEHGQVGKDHNKQYISWIKKLSAGQTVELKYKYQAPGISPQIYLLGPMEISGSGIFFKEARQWQLASDGLTQTWTGAVNGNWANPGNWSSGSAPSFGDDLVFPDGATTYSTNNDFGQNTLFNSITISGNGYTLAGNDIILGQGLAGITDSASSGGNTISLNIRMDVTRWITVTNSAETLTIDGMIAGAGGLNKRGLGKLIFSGANTYAGVTKIDEGIVNAQNATALGTIAAGTEVVGGASLELQGGITIDREALTLRGYGNSDNGALRNISGTNTFKGLITLVGIAKLQSDADTLNLRGGITGTIPLIFDGAGNIAFYDAPIATSTGLVTKNGSGTVIYNFPNTYTGTTTINAGTVLYGTDNAILTGGVTINGGTWDIANYSDTVGTVTLGTLTGLSGTITGTTGILNSTATYAVYNGTVSAILGGVVGLTKSTPATVVLTRDNLYTGTTTVSTGFLTIQSNNSLGATDGTTTVSSGATLQIDGNGLNIAADVTLAGVGVVNGANGVGALRNLANNNTWTGPVTISASGGATITSDSGTLTFNFGGLNFANRGATIDGAGNVTFGTAQISGTTGTLTKNGSGILTLGAFNNYTGATYVNAGTLVLKDNGASIASAFTVNSGAILTLDNSNIVADRLGDALTITMNGGDFNMIGNPSQDSLAIAGALTMSSGLNRVTITPSANNSTSMIFASLTISNGAAALFRGTSLGAEPGPNVSNIIFSSTPTLTGASGVAGTSTISIIKKAFGDNSLTGSGTDMVTYNIGNEGGVRLLNSLGYSDEYAGDLTVPSANVKLTADTAATSTNTNSLILNGYNITNASVTLPMASASLAGNILIDTANSIAGANTILGITTYELCVLAKANGTISATIGTAVAGLLTLSGSGNVTLSAANAYTGITYINEATLTYGASNVISSGGVTVNGGTLNLLDYSDIVGAVTLQRGIITSGSGILTSTSSYSVRSGTVSAILGGAVLLTKVNTNAETFSQVILTRENTYSGGTTVTTGVLKIGATGNGTNSPLGTIAGAGTISSGAALDLNGYTLSIARAFTINGTGVVNGGAIINSSSIPVSYSGALTLGAASRLNSDLGAITFSSNISGAYLLTVGGYGETTLSGTLSTITGVTKDGLGTLILSSSDSSFAGTTTVSSGTLKLGATGGGTNGPVGTIAGATSVTSGAVFDLNGYSLGTAEPLTLNGTGSGTGDFAGGALINSSGSAVTFSGNITLGAASMIRTDYGSINLSGSGGTGAYALTLTGSTDSSLAGTLPSGAGTIIKLGTNTWTLSGNSSFTGTTTIYQGTLQLGGAGSGSNGPLGTTGAATIILSGGVLDLNGYTLATAEAINTINGFGINGGGALVNSGGALSFSGAITLGTDSRIDNSGSGLLTLTGAISGAGFNLLVGGTGNITSGTGLISSTLGITKYGVGTVTINASETYTGDTTILAGTFAYGASGLLAGTNIYVKGGIWNMGGVTDTVAGVILVNGTIQNGTLTGTSYTFENGTISAVIAGAIAVNKNTNGTVTWTGVNTNTGVTSINQGTLVISGAGKSATTGVTINVGGTLTLDNTSTSVTTRLNNATPPAITMNGGNFNYIGSSSTTAAETDGALNITTGYNVVTITPGTGGSTTMTFASLSRSAGAEVLFRGTSFGTAPAANISTLKFTASPTLTGGGTGAGTSTISIIKGAFGDISLSGLGSDMVTYNIGNTNGLRLLNGAGYSGEYAGDLATASANVKLTANRAATNTNTNSLILNGYNITNASVTLPMASASLAGNILIDTANSIAGANTILGITTYELCVLAKANGSVSATIGTAVAGLMSLSGTGNVTLSAANAYTGLTYVNGATLTYGASNVISSGGVNVVGGTYNLNGWLDSIGAVSINAGTVQIGDGTLTLTDGVTSVANNYSSSIISSSSSGNLALGAGQTFTVNDGNIDHDLVVTAIVSGGTVGKAGAGVMLFSGNNTYTGITTVSVGILRLGTTGGALYTPLGTNAAGTTISGATAALDLNGYTLGTSEALTLGGTLATGALQNTSSTAVSYSGLITLSAASTIISNYGDINITNTGNITGTFNLTIGGNGNASLSSNINIGSGTLTKNGLGTWILSGSSSYTGTTSITGVIKLGAAGNGTNSPLGTSGAGTTVVSGAMLDLNGYTLSTTEGLTISGTGIAGAGALTNSSGSSVDYSGLLTLGAAASIISNAGDINITNSGNITGATFGLTIGGNGNGSLASNLNTTSGTLVKIGSGVWTVSGNSSYTGVTTISAGIFKLGGSGSGLNSPLGTIGAATTVSVGGILDLNGYTLVTAEPLTLNGWGDGVSGALINSSASSINYFGVITLGSTGVRIVASNGIMNLTAGTTSAATYQLMLDGTNANCSIGAITNNTTGRVTKNGSGTWTLTGTNTYTTGGTWINEGTIKYGPSCSLADTSPITVAGGTLDINGVSDTVAAVTLRSGLITDTVSGGTLTGSSYVGWDGSISAILGGAVTLTKTTTGTVSLDAANSYSGLTTITQGTLVYGINNALSNGGITVNGGTLDIGAYSDTVGTVTLTTGTITGAAGVLTSNANYAVASGTISAILSGTGIGVSKTTSGTVVLTRANTFDGTSSIAAGGALNIQNGGALGTGSVIITVASGGALQLQGGITVNNTKILSLAGTGVTNSGALRNISGINEWQGPINMTLASRIRSGRDILTISGDIGGAYGLTIGGPGDTTISGNIATGANTLTKDGAGTLTLSGDNNYTGLTTISLGVVNIQSPTALGTTLSGTTVASGAALQMQNNITVGTESLTLNGAGISDSGVLRNMSGDNTWQGAVTLNTGSTIGVDGDQLTLSGTVTGGASVGLTKVGGATLILSNTTTLGGNFTISAGTISASGNINVAGNWSNSGNFDAIGNTVTLNGANGSTQLISGSTTFNNLTITTVLSRTINFDAYSLSGNPVTTIAGLWTCTGQAGQNIILGRNGGSGSDQWHINPTAWNVNYVTPSNSRNLASSPINPSNYVDGGNNTNWLSPPDAPVLYNESVSSQIAFNNSEQNSTTPVVRTSATCISVFNRFQVEFNTAPNFAGTAYTETFSGTYSSGTPYNLQTTGALGMPSSDGVTYYLRVRASADGGTNYGDWSSGTWSYTYTAVAGEVQWYQTTDTQFNTGTLIDSLVGSDSVYLPSSDPVVLISGWTSNTVVPGNSLTLTKPSNIQNGDLLLIVVGNDNSTNTAQWDNSSYKPSGFTLINEAGNTTSDVHTASFYRVADGSEGATINVPAQSSNDYWGFYIRITGADPINPIGVIGDDYNYGNSFTHNIPSIDTVTDNTLVFYQLVADRGDSYPFSVAGDWTQQDQIQAGAGNSNDAGTWGTKEQPSPGATGDATVTINKNDGASGFQFAVRPVDQAGSIISPEIDFDSAFAQATWGVANMSTDESYGDVKLQVYYTVSSACDTIVSDGVLPGNSAGFDAADMPIDISGLTPVATTYNKICLKANLSGQVDSPYLLDWNVNWNTSGMSISGICKQYDQVTDCTDDGSNEIRVAFDGALQSQKQTVVKGTWSIVGLTAPPVDTIVTIFIDGESTAGERATTVSKYNGTGNIASINLYWRHLTIGSGQNNTITNANLALYDYSASGNNVNIIYDVDGSNNLTVDNLNNYSDERLRIRASNTYRPDSSTGRINTTTNLQILGTIIADANTFNIYGNWVNTSGTFTAGTSTVDFPAGSGTQQVTTGGISTGKIFNNVIHSGAGTIQLISNQINVDGNFSQTAGVFNTNSLNQFYAGNFSLSSGTTYIKGGTLTFDKAGTQAFSDATAGTQDLGDVIIGPSTTTAVVTNSSMRVTSLNINVDDALDISDDTLTIIGDGNPFTKSGVFTTTNSTVIYAGSGDTDITTTQYNNLTLTPDSGTPTFSLADNLTGSNAITGNLTINANSILDTTLNNYNISLAGSWANSGTFTANSSLVTLDGSSSQSLSGTMTSASAFYDLTITNNSGSSASDCGKTGFSAGVLFTNNATVTNNYIINTANVRVEYNSGSTYTFNNINWNGQALGTRIFFRQSSGGVWLLNVSGSQTVSKVDVAYSDASAGNLIIADDGTNNDCGDNTHWQFVTSNPPSVSNVQLNGQNNIDLIENSTQTVSAVANVYDAQGCNTITGVQAKIYRSGVGGAENCTNNANNCYMVASCTETSCVGTDAVYTCTINMQFHADPTDIGTPWVSEYWRAWIKATDNDGLYGTDYSPTNAPDVNSLLALDATSPIDYGALNMGDRIDPLDRITTVTATGNVSIDTTLYGTNMIFGSNNIPVGKQKYSLSSGTSYNDGVSLLVSPGQDADLNCPKTTDAGNKQTKDVWWGIEIPNPQASGSYSGTNTFEAKKNSLPWP